MINVYFSNKTLTQSFFFQLHINFLLLLLLLLLLLSLLLLLFFFFFSSFVLRYFAFSDIELLRPLKTFQQLRILSGTLQTHHVYSTLKRRGNNRRFNVEYKWWDCRAAMIFHTSCFRKFGCFCLAGT